MSSESAPTVIVTFIRHGESTDNLVRCTVLGTFISENNQTVLILSPGIGNLQLEVWAGWKDAPLSNHGMNQARALGKSLSNTRFAAVYASPLKRALWTGEAVRDGQTDPKPPLTESPLLREQHFGDAEGEPWSWNQTSGLSLEEHFAKGIWPVLHERSQKFPGGESLEDLGVRATKAIHDLVMPHIWQAAREGKAGVNIALASHGLCISELIPALLVKDESGYHPGDKYKGLYNTAWTRLTVEVQGAKEGQLLNFTDDNPPTLHIKVIDVNNREHLAGVVRQKGGIGRAAHDPKQRDIRAFFGGAKLEEGRAASNALDEADVEMN